MSVIANGYWLHIIDQVLWCLTTTSVDQMHQQAEFELNSASNWQPVDFFQSRCDVITHSEVQH